MALQSLEQLLAFIEAEIAAGRDPFGAGTPLGVQPGLPPPLDDLTATPPPPGHREVFALELPAP